MMDGLCIKMAIWSTIGDYLEASGWIAALTPAGRASSGTADSFLKVSHLSRTRPGHQLLHWLCQNFKRVPSKLLKVFIMMKLNRHGGLSMTEKSPTF